MKQDSALPVIANDLEIIGSRLSAHESAIEVECPQSRDPHLPANADAGIVEPVH